MSKTPCPAIVKDMERFRKGIDRLVEPLGEMPEADRPSYRHFGLPLNLHPTEFAILSEVTDGGQYPSGWKGKVLDSVVLAVMWAEYCDAEARGRPLPWGERLPPGEFQALVESGRRDLDRVREGMVAASPTVLRVIESGYERCTRLLDEVGRLRAGMPLDRFLAPVDEGLRRLHRTAKGGVRAIGIRPAQDTRRNLTQAEEEALLGSPGTEPGNPVVRFYRVSAVASVKTARDYGWLDLPEGAVLSGEEASEEEKAADLDALELLAMLAKETMTLARVRTDHKLLESIVPVQQRLEELAGACRRILGQRREALPRHGFTPPVTMDELREGVGAKTKAAAVEPPANRAAAGSAARAGAEEARAVRPTVSVPAFVGAILLVVAGTAVATFLRTRQFEHPVVASPFDTSDLASFFPEPKIVTPPGAPQTTVHVQIGQAWSQISGDEQSKRIFLACQFLSGKAYTEARFLAASGAEVAQWVHGGISFSDATAATGP